MFSGLSLVQGTAQGFGGIACLYLLGEESSLKDLIATSFHPSFVDSFSSTPARFYLSYFGEKESPIDHLLWTWLSPEESFFGRRTLALYLHGGKQSVFEAKNYLKAYGFEEYPAFPLLNDLKRKFEATAFEYALKSVSSLACDVFLQQYEGVLRCRFEGILHKIHQGEREEAEISLKALLKTASFGKALQEKPLSFLFCGTPNVGKSSLFNCLLGEERSLVSEQAGTTIDLVRMTRLLKGFPIQLVDSVGLSSDPSFLEKLGSEKLQQEWDQGIPLWVMDATLPFGQQKPPVGFKSLVIWNKTDLQTPPPLPSDLEVEIPILSVSALEGRGILEIEAYMESCLPSAFPAEDGVLFTGDQEIFVQSLIEALSSQDPVKTLEVESALNLFLETRSPSAFVEPL